ncbi:hypothetical protein N7508_002063 [Penicillium antarcticum]|uniref:uncharacterized protein n=1 Tax=Penicillium antarcticum TaxID=416450 RepID=UPI0023965D66|nr:uncharacterized protein N7508_002063 [Penicillium antarcticum]KAJ5317555.1 hypothetical protein N7508_002063 [Penicillium antarcticum]
MSSSNITLSSNILGTIGTVLWCIQLIPQIWHNWRRKNTDGFPASMMFLWACCSVPMGAYLVLQIQPQIFGFFSLISWGQCICNSIAWVVLILILDFNSDYSKTRAFLVCSGMIVLFGGLEAILILTLRIPYNNGVTWPDIVVGVVATLFLSAGLLPPYFELWKRDGRVIGFNWVFLSIDTLGGLFSLFALAAQGSFDILGGIMYILVYVILTVALGLKLTYTCRVVLESGIYISHTIWRIRYRKLRKEAKTRGISIDELLDENNIQDTHDLEKGGYSGAREG